MNARQPLSQVGSHRAMQADAIDIPDDSGHITITLTLGCATVDVEYVLIAGCPLVQGATVNDEWVDVDCFAKSVGAGWRRDIERSLGIGQ